MKTSEEQDPAWAEISVSLSPEAHEAMGAFLIELGCDGSVVQPDDETRLRGYLPLPADLSAVKEKIQGFLQELGQIFPDLKAGPLTVSRLRNQDWSRGWRRFFRPVRATPGLLIVPAWERIPADAPGEVILVDPGPAFGTGRHATTRMCLLAMERARLEEPWSMLDVGTGSGILAVHGAKLGAGRIVALDNDPDALRWAERNIALNGLTGRIELVNGEPRALKETFSLLVANLTLATILDLLPGFPRLIGPGGLMILSGLLRNQVKEVRAALRSQGFFADKILHRGEWAAVIARRGPS
ncbi:MAG: 50S ribosomal protein L11 methyltransferase [Thermodesulfobacteriota bacterium]